MSNAFRNSDSSNDKASQKKIARLFPLLRKALCEQLTQREGWAVNSGRESAEAEGENRRIHLWAPILQLAMTSASDVQLKDTIKSTHFLLPLAVREEAMTKAIESNDPEALSAAVVAGLRVDAPLRALRTSSGSGGIRALHYAAQTGKVQCVRMLLQLGCDVNARDGDGDTALSFVVRAARAKELQEVGRVLVEAGSDMEVHVARGDTPLYLAIMRGLDDLAIAFVENGCDLRHHNSDGNLAIIMATRKASSLSLRPC